MKRYLCALLCTFLCLCLLAACLPAVPQGQPAAFQPVASSLAAVDSGAESTAPPVPEAGSAGSLRVLLPAESDVLAGLLAQMAEAEGIALTVLAAHDTEAYIAQVLAALAEPDAPDMVFLEGYSDAQVVGAWQLEDLAGTESPAPLAALARLVPTGSRLLENSRVYGLPLGWRAEGYLVDMDMLAALLGASSPAQLLADVQKATWAQWSQMLAALEIYLARPAMMRVPLGDNAYITPARRPQIARPLRGIFAFADAAPEAMMQSALDAALYAPYENPRDWLRVPETEKRELLFPSLEALYALMDFETLHMARTEGAVYRGPDYLVHPALSREEAGELFGEGTALLYRADTQTGFALAQAHPRLEGRLALLPVKLPPPVLAAEEGGADGTEDASSSQSAGASGSSGGETQTETPEEEAAEETAARRTAAGIEAHNSRCWYSAGGYLCVNMQSINKEAAQALLLRLFTTREGAEGIQSGLHLHPFGQLLPQDGLSAQLAGMAATTESPLLPAPESILAGAGQAIGAHVATQLIGVEEWDEEEAYGFLVASMEALGYRLE